MYNEGRRSTTLHEAKLELKQLIRKFDKLNVQEFYVYADLPPNQPADLYFSDGFRKIDFIFVYKNLHVEKPKQRNRKEKVNSFIENLEEEGFEFEGEPSVNNPDLTFIKLHAPRKLLLRYSCVFSMQLNFDTKIDYPLPEKRITGPKCKHTFLTNRSIKSEIIDRTDGEFSQMDATDITSAERIMIVYEILKHIKYGDDPHDYGIDSLIKHKYLEAAYPLHDGTSEWSNTEMLNDRQLLRKYWSSLKMFIKVQPLDLIQKYYGPEVAFYFAFAGHLNTMTIPAAVVGMCSVLYGLLTIQTPVNHMSDEICSSDLELCPYCNSKSICQYSKVKDFCFQSKLSYSMDNIGSFIYAIIMCFWATLFLELWKRKQARLCYRWNLTYVEEDATSRPEFRIKAKHRRISKYTGFMEPYVPTKIRFIKMTCSFIVILISAVIVLAAVILSVVLKIFMKFMVVKIRPSTQQMFVTVISASIANSAIVVFMLIFEQVYDYVARFLTEYENPRTQSDYDKSYIYKVYVLSFLNAYSFLYYTAFIKGKLYTSPEDISKSDGIGLVRTDSCGPEGCVMYLSYQLIFVLIAKSIFNHALSYIAPLAIPYIKRKLKHEKLITSQVSIWEYSYYFEVPSDHYYLLKFHLETVIYFGYVIIFTAALPLAPVISLLFNAIMIRLYGFELTKIDRRPVPLSVSGIRAWNNILRTLTYIAVATNAFLVAFTTNLVPIIFTFAQDRYYRFGYLNSSLSEFYISDFEDETEDSFKKGREGSCYYVSKRYPPYHDRKYDLNGNYWEELAMRFLCVLVIESFVLCFTALLAFIIPDVPRSVQDRLDVRERQEMIIRENQLNAAFRNLNT